MKPGFVATKSDLIDAKSDFMAISCRIITVMGAIWYVYNTPSVIKLILFVIFCLKEVVFAYKYHNATPFNRISSEAAPTITLKSPGSTTCFNS